MFLGQLLYQMWMCAVKGAPKMKILFACITNLLNILHLKGIKVSKIVKRDPNLSNSSSSKNNNKIMSSYSKKLVLKYLNPSIILLTGSSEETSGLGGQAGPVCPVHCISTVMLSILAAATSSRYSSFSLQPSYHFISTWLFLLLSIMFLF